MRPLLFGVFVDGPVDDYMPFHDLGPQAAARLLEVLPEAQLADYDDDLNIYLTIYCRRISLYIYFMPCIKLRSCNLFMVQKRLNIKYGISSADELTTLLQMAS